MLVKKLSEVNFMSSQEPIQDDLKSKLVMLFKIKKANPGVHINFLDDLILNMKAIMPQQDYVWVEKMMEEL